MHNNTEWELLRRQRLRLTKIWLLLLALNIVLQFQAVEDFFDGPKTDSSRFVAADFECSSLPRLLVPQNQDQMFTLFSGTMGITNSSDSHTATIESTVLELPSWQASNGWMISGIHSLANSDFLLVSGLSPPLFS